MYSIQKAAEILDRSETTVRRWMKIFNIKVVQVETDRNRAYIADDDLNILVDHITQKVVNSAYKRRKHQRQNKHVITTREGKYYSFLGAASLLGVSVITIKRWSEQDEIGQQPIRIGRRQMYLPHDALLQMAELHKRTLSPKALAEMSVQREVNTTQTNMDKLCNTKEVSLYLDISHTTARKWISEANIELKTKFMGKEARYITYRDVVRLADLRQCEIVPDALPLSIREEIEVLKSKMEKMVSDIEDLKHDFRLFIKRSIYIR